MKFKITKGKVFLLVAVVLVGGFIYMSSQRPAPSLMVSSAKVQDIESYLSTTGYVTKQPVDEFVVSGTSLVKDVHVKIGDTVKAGDILVTFDNSDIQEQYKLSAISYEKTRLSLDEIENEFFKTKEEIREAQEDIERYDIKMEDNKGDPTLHNYYEQLWERARSSKKALEKALPSDESLKIRQLGYEEAKLAMDRAQKLLNEAPGALVATTDGVVESIMVQKLSTAPKGTVAVTVRPTATDTVDFNIGRYDVDKIRVGQTVTATISGQNYTGTVTEIKPVATGDSYVPAKVKLDNPDTLVPGIGADLEILTYSAESVLTVSIESTRTDKSGDYCYVLEASAETEGLYTPVKTYIKVGKSSDLTVEILDGLSEGQFVLVQIPSGIERYTAVNIIPVE